MGVNSATSLVRPHSVQMRTPGGNFGFGPGLLRVWVTDSTVASRMQWLHSYHEQGPTAYIERVCRCAPRCSLAAGVPAFADRGQALRELARPPGFQTAGWPRGSARLPDSRRVICRLLTSLSKG
jgi:hypothetical protein